MAGNIVAGYGQGQFGPSGMIGYPGGVLSSCWTRIILSLFHPNGDGDIHFNNTPMFVGDEYLGGQQWIDDLHNLVEPSSGNAGPGMSLSIGGGGVGDFANIKSFYEIYGSSFDKSPFKENFDLLIDTFGDIIDTIDLDCEDTYDQESFLAFCQLIISAGKKLTFAPYTEMASFWIPVLQSLNASNPGAVTGLNLQCYSSEVNVTDWVNGLKSAGIETDNFIIYGVKYGGKPSAIYETLHGVSTERWFAGAFIWTIDETSYVEALANGVQQRIIWTK